MVLKSTFMVLRFTVWKTMEKEMKKLLVLALVCATSSAFAAERTVHYQCGAGKNLKVTYQFNDAGLPTQAKATLQGKTRTMAYNQNESDNVDTIFNSREGYRLSSSYMDSQNYREQGIVITSPKDEMLFKNCSATQTAPKTASAPTSDAAAVSATKRVAYKCQGGKKLSVEYGFNAFGLPVYASANLAGKQIKLPYNLDNSDNVSAFFMKNGYTLSADAITVDNYRHSPVMVTAPNDQILYKGCSAQ